MDDLAEKKKTNSLKKEELAKELISIAKSFDESPQQIVEYLKFASQFYRYSAKNMALVFNQNPNAMFLGSYQYFKEMGYPVKNGQHGMKIFVPVNKMCYRKIGDQQWKPLSIASKKDKAAIKAKIGFETRTISTYTLGTVFDISQTTYPPEKYPELLHFGQKDLKAAVLLDGLKEYCTIVNIPLEENADLNTLKIRGYYQIGDEKIVINHLLQDDEKLSTLTHELGHRLMFRNSNPKEELAKPESQIELEADALSYMILQHFNQDITDGRKHHLSLTYEAYIADQEKKEIDQRVGFLDIMENVKKVYNNEIELLDEIVDKHLEINRNIYQLENSDYAAQYEVRFLENEYNKYLDRLQDSDLLPIPEKMTVYQTQKMIDQIEQKLYEKKDDKIYEVKYYIIDLEDEQTVFKGSVELGMGLHFLDYLTKECNEINNIIKDPELMQSFKETMINLKEDAYKEQLYDYNKNFSMLDAKERSEVIDQLKSAKQERSINSSVKENSLEKKQLIIKKEEVIEK